MDDFVSVEPSYALPHVGEECVASCIKGAIWYHQQSQHVLHLTPGHHWEHKLLCILVGTIKPTVAPWCLQPSLNVGGKALAVVGSELEKESFARKEIIHGHAKANGQVASHQEKEEFRKGPCTQDITHTKVGQSDLSCAAHGCDGVC